MPTAVAPVSTIPAKLNALELALGGVLFERPREIETLTVSAIAHRHHCQFGVPGIAKSLLINSFVGHISGLTDEDFFWWLMTRYTTPEEVMGMPAFSAMQQDKWTRNTEYKLPRARFGFLDEMFNSNSAMLNTLLTIMNEGFFFNGGPPTPTDVVICTGTNQLPKEPEYQALWDRVTFRVFTKPIRDRGNRRQMLTNKLRGSVPIVPVIDWTDIKQAREEVKTVDVPTGVIDKLMELWDSLEREGIEPSPRRMSDCIPVIQATCYKSGRMKADVSDLRLLRHMLWLTVDQIPTVDKLVLELANPIDRKAMDLLEVIEKLGEEATALIRDNDDEKARRREGVILNGKLDRAANDLERLAEEATDSKARSDMITEVELRLKGITDELLLQLYDIKEGE